jgi:hypothetical protein
MTTQSDLLHQVWDYPLFEALYGRRTRRVGLGFELGGPFKYTSGKTPVPLSELEEALLVAAGIGFSGLALWDQSNPSPYRGGDGRTFASTCHGRRTALFFTNDRGVHVIDRRPPAKLREVETSHERQDILALYRDHRRELKAGRLAIPRRVPPLCGHNLWDCNMPGSTLFMPVCDVSSSLISLIAQFVDPRLERFAAKQGRGALIVDDRHGFRPAGTQPWVSNGFLDEAKVVTLSELERQACYYMFSEPAAICQNMFLATEAIGLGGWMHCGFLSREIFAALGFRTVVAAGKPLLANPVGLDGVLQACCPPYFPSMDAAVDAVLGPVLPDNAASAPPPPAALPFLMPEAEHRRHTVAISADGVACTKAICNYIHDTYGRFPGNLDAMHLMWFFQAHHLDTAFYDRFYRPGAYGPTQAAHMATWHNGS